MRKRPGSSEVAPIYLPIDEAYPLLGIGRSKFYELISQDVIRTIKVGRRRLVCYESLRQLGNELG